MGATTLDTQRHELRPTRKAMICHRCGGENPVSFRYCGNCGAQLGLTCMTCGFQSPPESTFCCGCGTRFHDVWADAQGEHRQLTVLFCDVAASAELTQYLDPDDLAVVIRGYQKVCRDAVLAHEGHIAQYLGDGVVMYFGYPRSHEDEVQRAVRCGLDILKGVGELRTRRANVHDVPFDVRLGGHTGRVLVSAVEAGDRRDRLALGDTPNIAARVQSEAEAGTLVVSETTWKIVEGYFTGVSLGESQLKGMSEPTRLWRVTCESASRERVEVARTLTPFVGRQLERSILAQAWNDSQNGQSHFVLLRGEPGIGKSRLAQLFRNEMQSAADGVLVTRATPYDTNTPFHPAINLIKHRFGLNSSAAPAQRLDALERALRGLGLVDSEAVVLLASLLAIPTDDRYTPLELSPSRRRHRTMELIVELVAAAAAAGPTLMFVEDLQWADASTVDLLELLVTTAPRVPLLGVFTARPDFDMVPHWTTPTTFRRIELSKFERTETEAVVRAVMSGKVLPHEVVSKIVARSDGVPLFIEELTRSVMDSRVVGQTTAGGENAGAAATETIPATMDASLASRIDRLGSSRATAQLAATIGREFTVELLVEVSDRDSTTIGHDLERLLQARLAYSAEDEPDTLVFKHALVRDAAYDSLVRATRQSYHRRIAAALRRRYTDDASSRPHVIAHHLTGAGEHEDAVAFWQKAGHRALTRAGFHEAADHFQQAIDCLQCLPSTPERRAQELELQILLAPLLMAVYGWGSVEVERACERGLALAEELQRLDQTYPPMWGLWTVHFLRGQMTPALEKAERVLTIAKASGVPMLEVTGHHAVAYTLVYKGDFERALEEADAGLRLHDIEQEKQWLADTFLISSSVCLLATRAHALWMMGRVVDAEECWAEMLQLGRDLQHPPSLAGALAFTLHGGGFRYSYAGQMERLLDIAEELIDLSQNEDFFFWYADAYWYRGVIAEAMGDAELARTEMREGAELFARTGARLSLVMMNVICAEALYRMGDDDEAFRLLDLAEADMTARGEGLLAPDIWRVRGRLLARRGNLSEAEAAYNHAMEQARAQHAVSLELRAALDFFELRDEQGRAEEGRILLYELLKNFTQGFDRPELARASAIARGMPHTLVATDRG
jgi:class 3 adenylate cyclase/tetratricopeptide (TPR) repeat protein